MSNQPIELLKLRQLMASYPEVRIIYHWWRALFGLGLSLLAMVLVWLFVSLPLNWLSSVLLLPLTGALVALLVLNRPSLIEWWCRAAGAPIRWASLAMLLASLLPALAMLVLPLAMWSGLLTAPLVGATCVIASAMMTIGTWLYLITTGAMQAKPDGNVYDV